MCMINLPKYIRWIKFIMYVNKVWDNFTGSGVYYHQIYFCWCSRRACSSLVLNWLLESIEIVWGCYPPLDIRWNPQYYCIMAIHILDPYLECTTALLYDAGKYIHPYIYNIINVKVCLKVSFHLKTK